jgi:chromosome segregation ATPase
LKSQLDVATGELAVLQTAIGGLNTKLAQVRQDLVLETAKLGAVTKQYNHSQQQADIFENALNECRKELAEEQKQHKLLKTTKAPTGGTGPKADHADTSATAKLDDAVSQLLLQL